MTTKPRGSQPGIPARILVPYDFSACAGAALDYAILLARPWNATITLLHLVESAPAGFLMEGGPARQTLGLWRAKAAQKLAELQRARAGEARFGRALVKSGKAWAGIVQVAEKLPADLVVMGTHGHSGLKLAWLGSVAERVVRQAPCPVLTVRPRGRAAE